LKKENAGYTSTQDRPRIQRESKQIQVAQGEQDVMATDYLTEELTPKRSYGQIDQEDETQHDNSFKKTTSFLSLRLNGTESVREWNSEEEGKINLAQALTDKNKQQIEEPGFRLRGNAERSQIQMQN